jgi:hypothetical protein
MKIFQYTAFQLFVLVLVLLNGVSKFETRGSYKYFFRCFYFSISTYGFSVYFIYNFCVCSDSKR